MKFYQNSTTNLQLSLFLLDLEKIEVLEGGADVGGEVLGEVFDFQPIPLMDVLAGVDFADSFGQVVDQDDVDFAFRGFFPGVGYEWFGVLDFYLNTHFFFGFALGVFD